MTKANAIWKRLGALLLAIALVVGMCPVQAFAEEATEDPVNKLTLKLYGVDQQAAWDTAEEYENRGEEVPSKVWNANLLGTRDKENRPEKQYIYIADVLKADPKDVRFFMRRNPTGDENGVIQYQETDKVDGYAFGKNARISFQTDEEESFSVRIVCDGLVLNGALPKGTGSSAVFIWEGKTAEWDSDLKYGVPVTLGAFTPSGVNGVETGEVIPEDVWTASYFEEGAAEGTMVPVKLIDTQIKMVERTINVNGTIRQVEELNGTITYPEYNAEFKIGENTYKAGDTAYLSEELGMTITVNNKDLGAVKMPEIQGVEWKLDGTKWIGTMEKAKTVTLGNETLKVVVDDKAPEISDAVAYMDGDEAVVEFSVTALSGLKSVTVNGKDVTEERGEDGFYTLSDLELSAEDKVTIAAESKAGLSATKEIYVADKLHFTYELINAKEIPDTDNYVKLEGNHTSAHVEVKLHGAEKDGAPDIVSIVENETGLEIAKGAWSKTYNLPIASEIKLEAKDSEGRTDDITIPAFQLDTEAPSITVSVKEGDTVHGDISELKTTKDTTVTVTVTDNVKLPDLTKEHVTFSVQTPDGQTNDHYIDFEMISSAEWAASITIKDQERLVNITRAVISDAAGFESNEIEKDVRICVDAKAPEITTKLSGNIRGLLTTADNRLFAILEPVTDTDTKGTETVTLTYNWSDFSGSSGSNEGKCFAETVDKCFTVDVGKNTTNKLDFSIPAVDNHGNRVKELTIGIEGSEATLENATTTATIEANEAGFFEGTIYIDRRIPGTNTEKIPKVVWKAEKVTTVDGKDLYKGDEIQFEVEITDSSVNGSDSGMESISWALTGADYLRLDAGNLMNADGTQFELRDNGEYKFSVTTKNQKEEYLKGETNTAVLSVTVTDKAGNNYTHSYSFAHDNLPPRVNIEKENPGNIVEEVEYSKGGLEYKITVNDLFLAEVPQEQGGIVKAYGSAVEKNTDGTYVVVVDKDLGKEAIVITAIDKADNVSAKEYDDFTLNNGVYKNKNGFIIDKEAPVVTVTRNAEPVKKVEGEDKSSTDYYAGKVTYTVTVADSYMSDVGEDTKAVLNLAYTVNGEEYVVSLPTQENTEPKWTKAEGKDTYTYEFTLSDGDILTGITIQAVDNAGNPFTGVSADSNVSFDGTSYSGGTVIVDTTAPEVTVNRNINPVNSTDSNTYYDDTVEYTITVKDANFDANNFSVELDGQFAKEKEVAYNANSATFELIDGDKLDNITITVRDYAHNTPKSVAFTCPKEDAADEDVAEKYAGNEGVFSWDGNKPVIVDKTNPTATLTISSNQDVFKGYVTHIVGDKVYYYLKLNEPDVNTEETVKIQAVLDVRDKNLLEDDLYKNPKQQKDSSTGWHYNLAVNSELSYAYYVQEINVDYNNTAMLKLDLHVSDAVGHVLQDVTLKTKTEDGTTLGTPVNLDEVPIDLKADGNVVTNIIMDRRRPTTDTENAIPEITISAPETTLTVGDNVPLYAENPSFGVIVNDGMKGTADVEHAGLYKVDVELTNGTPNRGALLKIDNYGKEYSNENNQYEYKPYNATIVTEGGPGECNNYKLEVVAQDYVGNIISVTKQFAVDTMEPEIKVEYLNDVPVKNEFYFNANRTARITVTDLNFNAAATTISTQVDPTGWIHSEDGLTHEATCSYTVDGDYTFDITTKDLTGKSDPKVEYVGEAPTKFTIDKTNPIISVAYDPNEPSSVDKNHVSYYNKNTTATVTIEERNFRETDVLAKFNSNNKLSGFNSNGDSHKANTLFTDGNRYEFSIEYVDLAGNPAVPYKSHIFSVDTHKPTIEITRGDMTNEEINMVSDDLVLQFRLTDEQKNLAGYEVKITHLNNKFESVVVSGRDYYTVDVQENGNTVYVNMTNILKEKIYDGIYTVEITGYDHAGNVVELEPPLVFSLNRFGSTFTTNDPYTIEFLKPSADGIAYHNSVDQKLIIQEINPNQVFHTKNDANKTRVEGSMLTVVANGTSVTLEENKDYTVTVTQKQKKNDVEIQTWYVYTYEINPDIFQDANGFVNGRYSILFYSEDEAGNMNTNEANEFSTVQMDKEGQYTGKLEFVVDTMPPVITTTGIESNEVYDAAFQRMEIFLSDTTPAGIQVYLNGEEVVLNETAVGLTDNAAWLIQDAATGAYTLNVPEQNELFGSQNVRIVANDAAGNSAEKTVEEFNVTTSMLVRFINNIWAVGGSVLGLGALIFYFIMQWKKKKL